MLYDHIISVLAEREPKPTLLVNEAREHLLQSIRFLEKRGFQSVMRTPTSQIDLTTFDAGQYAELMDRVLANGIKIQTLSVLRERDPDWQRKLYDLDWEGTQDEPLPDAPTSSPLMNILNGTLSLPNSSQRVGLLPLTATTGRLWA